jgi:hypothetical protein
MPESGGAPEKVIGYPSSSLWAPWKEGVVFRPLSHPVAIRFHYWRPLVNCWRGWLAKLRKTRTN